VTLAEHFVELDKALHDRGSFDCGADELNEFIQQFAVRHREAGISKTMVLPERERSESKQRICAFYTLSHTEIERKTLPETLAKKLPRYPVPVMLIAQLAIHKDAQGQGLGKVTLVCALRHCLEIDAHLPSYAVVVDALDDGVQAFYEQYGFTTLDRHNGRIRLYLPMKTVEKLF
jgi:GNAT superfamily N-acetyltransferase